MSSQTPNINLTLPTGADNVSRQIINDNNTKIDTAIGTLNGKVFVSLGSITASTINDFLKSICTSFLAKNIRNTTVSISATWASHNYYIGLIIARTNGDCTFNISTSNNSYSGSYENNTQILTANSAFDKIANIGTVILGTGSVSSVANATYTTVQTATISKGTWLIIRGCDFKANATGIRRVGADDSSDRNASANQMAVSGTDTYLQFIDYKTVNSDTTINNVVYQTSGSTLNIWPYMIAIKISE